MSNKTITIPFVPFNSLADFNFIVCDMLWLSHELLEGISKMIAIHFKQLLIDKFIRLLEHKFSIRSLSVTHTYMYIYIYTYRHTHRDAISANTYAHSIDGVIDSLCSLHIYIHTNTFIFVQITNWNATLDVFYLTHFHFHFYLPFWSIEMLHVCWRLLLFYSFYDYIQQWADWYALRMCIGCAHTILLLLCHSAHAHMLSAICCVYILQRLLLRIDIYTRISYEEEEK